MKNSKKLLEALEYAIAEYCIKGFTCIAFGNSIDSAIASAESLNQDLMPVRKLIAYLQGETAYIDHAVYYSAFHIIQKAHSGSIKRCKLAEKNAGSLQERLQSINEFEIMKGKYSYIYSQLENFSSVDKVA